MLRARGEEEAATAALLWSRAVIEELSRTLAGGRDAFRAKPAVAEVLALTGD